MARHTFIIEVEIPDRYGDPAEHYEDIEERLMYEEIKGDMGDYVIKQVSVHSAVAEDVGLVESGGALFET